MINRDPTVCYWCTTTKKSKSKIANVGWSEHVWTPTMWSCFSAPCVFYERLHYRWLEDWGCCGLPLTQKNGRTPSSKSWVEMNFHDFPSPLFTHLFVWKTYPPSSWCSKKMKKRSNKTKAICQAPACFFVSRSSNLVRVLKAHETRSFSTCWSSKQSKQFAKKNQTINPTSNHQFQNLLLRNRNLQNHQIRLLLPTMVQHLGYIVPSLLPVMHHFLPYPAAQQIESRDILRSWSTIPRTFGDHPKSWHHHRKQTHHHLQHSPGGEVFLRKTGHIGNWLVVEPSIWKNISQNGSLPQIGMRINKFWNHHLGK